VEQAHAWEVARTVFNQELTIWTAGKTNASSAAFMKVAVDAVTAYRKAVEERHVTHATKLLLGTQQPKRAYSDARQILTLENEEERKAREEKLRSMLVKSSRSSHESLQCRRTVPKAINTIFWKKMIVATVDELHGGELDPRDIADKHGAESFFGKAATKLARLSDDMTDDEKVTNGEFPKWKSGNLGTHVKTLYCDEKKIILGPGTANTAIAKVCFEVEFGVPGAEGTAALSTAKLTQPVPSIPSLSDSLNDALANALTVTLFLPNPRCLPNLPPPRAYAHA
jgi:hypothetical protein